MSEDNIFREVDEELRSERMRNMWRRYGPIIIGGAIAVVLLVAANEGWSWWKDSNSARSSDQLYTAFDQAEAGDLAAAQESLNTVISDGSGEYPVLAEFRQAGLLAKDGKADEAVAAYDALSGSMNQQRMRELALVLSAFLLVDNGDVNAVKTRVEGLIASNSPLRNTAREALGLAQYKAGDLKDAQATFETIAADPSGAADQLGRVQLYLAQLVAEGVLADDADTAEADTAPAADATTDTAAPAEAETTGAGN